MCLFPIHATAQIEGRPKLDKEGTLRLPCGTCSECLKKRAMEWSLRAKHEIASHEKNCFLTLTYDENHLPSNFIIKSDFQRFIRAIRTNQKIRYMVSYEYGSNTFRPHMHALLFGYSPNKQKLLKRTSGGNTLFTSPEISRHWDKGYHSIGDANTKTAYYIAAYALKGKTHDLMHPTTGECTKVRDSMDSSRRPAIGLEYFKKNYRQLLDSKQILPRYYLKQLAKLHPDLFAEYQNEQMFNLKTRSSDENLAKYYIDFQKLDQSQTNYRETILDKQLHEGNMTHLKQTRDEYVTHQRKRS